ncbi:MAG: hypothetical protein V1661_00190 [bacterium]
MIVTLERFEPIACTGRGRAPKKFFDAAEERAENLSKSDVLFKECGHYGSAYVRLIFWDVDFQGKVEKKKENGVKTAHGRCAACTLEYWKKYAIRCAFCGCAILPGNPVILRHPASIGINREVAVCVHDHVISCVKRCPAPYGGIFSGFWNEDGFHPPFGKK